ncbi:MAG: SDR family NAD(P)-dependent oxidoreductase, partial [Myxococcales bacterium]|nr:SDR family NAD(P)-dependent oxidoreductase [Myxococcales bacterium]
MGTLNGRIALVTGGSRSLGREIALRLAEAGADVVITYKSNEAAAHDTARAIEALGAKAVVLQADLTGTAALPDIVGRVEAALDQHFGGRDLNILINNAGITGHGTFDTLTEEALDALYQTNLKSGLFLIQRLLPRLKDGGRIINVSSGLCRFTVPGMGAYACLKSAVETATRYLAKELGGRRITVNVVAPGALDTDF